MRAERPRLLDVNVLVALSITTHVHHASAHSALSEMPAWSTCPVTEIGLLRLLLNPAVTGQDRSVDDVLAVLRGMRADARWSFLVDDSSPAEAVTDVDVIASHRHMTDLHLLDLAARKGAVLATFDASLAAIVSPRDREHLEVLPVL